MRQSMNASGKHGTAIEHGFERNRIAIFQVPRGNSLPVPVDCCSPVKQDLYVFSSENFHGDLIPHMVYLMDSSTDLGCFSLGKRWYIRQASGFCCANSSLPDFRGIIRQRSACFGDLGSSCTTQAKH